VKAAVKNCTEEETMNTTLPSGRQCSFVVGRPESQTSQNNIKTV
jgi:hypothetical protein